MDIDELLRVLGKHLTIDNLRLDQNNVCRIVFKSGTQIFVEPDYHNEYVHLYAVLGELPEINCVEFYESIFERNLFGRATGQAAIQCDKDQREVLLCSTFDPRLTNPGKFIEIYEAFVRNVRVHTTWLTNLRLHSITPPSKELHEIQAHFLKV